MMRRIMDVMCGVLIGVGLLGFYSCFCEDGFDLGDKLFYVVITITGGIMTMVDVNRKE